MWRKIIGKNSKNFGNKKSFHSFVPIPTLYSSVRKNHSHKIDIK